MNVARTGKIRKQRSTLLPVPVDFLLFPLREENEMHFRQEIFNSRFPTCSQLRHRGHGLSIVIHS